MFLPGGAFYLGATSTALRVVTWNVGAINNNPFEYWTKLDGWTGVLNTSLSSFFP